MKTKMKGKSKRGKAIMGIALAAIMLASVFVAIFSVPALALTTPVNNENWLGEGKGNVTVTPSGTTSLIIGETINFDVEGLDIIGVSDDVEGQTRGTTSPDYETSVEFKDGDDDYLWAVDYNGDGLWNSALDMKISLAEPTLEIEIQDTSGKSIDSITIGKDIWVKISSNLFTDDMVKLKITGPEGTWTEFSGAVEEANREKHIIGTDTWTTGSYEIWVVTRADGDDARGLDISSTKDTITMRKAEIEIEAATTTPPKEKTVTFTVKAPPYEPFNFVTTHPEDVVMTYMEKNPLDLPSGGEVTMDKSDDYGFVEGGFDAATDEDGIYKFVTKFTDDRTYTFKLWIGDAATYGAAPSDERDDIDIDVGKIAVTINVPRTEVIGEDVTIKVTASAGDDVDIVIDDILEFNDEVLVDGEAEVEWKTAGKTVGSYTIEVLVNCDELTAADVGDDVEDTVKDLDVDETATIRLIEPGVTAEQPRDLVADGDDYVIKGTVTGVDEVDIVIIGPDGLTERELGIEEGLEITTSSVSDNEFEEEIDIPDGSDAGTYVAMVLIPGRDGDYADLTDVGDGEFNRALAERMGVAVGDLADALKGKNKAQLISIIGDASFDRVGSDDLYAMLTFRVSSPYVEIEEPIATVAADEPLVIEITTNRQDDVAITVTSPDCPELPGETVRVKDGKANVTIDTTGVPAGTWTIEAEDDDGNIDTSTVTIGAAPAPPAPTATPTAVPTAAPTAIPTAAATPTATPTATPEPPGFEAVFAIAGLLSIAYLVLRRRK